MPSVNFNKIQKLVLEALEDGEKYTIASLTQKISDSLPRISDSVTKIHRSSVEKALNLIKDSQSAKKVHFEWPRKIWMEKV